MNNKLIIITFCLFFIMFIVGCKTIGLADNVPQSLQLSGDNITVGEVLTAELKYNAKDDTLRDQLIAEALKGTTYDFLIMPRYEIFKDGLITKMRVRGRGARVDGEICDLSDPPELALQKKHTIEVVVDRFKVRSDF